MTVEELHLLEHAQDFFFIDREKGFWLETQTWEDLIELYKNHYLYEAEPGRERKSYESL